MDEAQGWSGERRWDQAWVWLVFCLSAGMGKEGVGWALESRSRCNAESSSSSL